MRRRDFTSEETEGMVALYESTHSLREVAAQFSCARRAVKRALRGAGVAVESKQGRKRQYQCDESFFDHIDTEDKAYWLGFLTADGAIQRNRLQLCLSRRDREHLGKFLASLRSSHVIYDGVKHNKGVPHLASEVVICSDQLAAALARLGVWPNKVYRTYPWEGPHELRHHYWRGVFDGDGYMVLDKRYGTWRLGVCGTHHIVGGFAAFAAQASGGKVKLPCPVVNIFRVEYTGVSLPQDIATALFAGATISLDRKRADVERMLAIPRRRKPRPRS